MALKIDAHDKKKFLNNITKNPTVIFNTLKINANILNLVKKQCKDWLKNEIDKFEKQWHETLNDTITFELGIGACNPLIIWSFKWLSIKKSTPTTNNTEVVAKKTSVDISSNVHTPLLQKKPVAINSSQISVSNNIEHEDQSVTLVYNKEEECDFETVAKKKKPVVIVGNNNWIFPAHIHPLVLIYFLRHYKKTIIMSDKHNPMFKNMELKWNFELSKSNHVQAIFYLAHSQ